MPATKQMTQRAALAEARKRWGKGGGVIKRKSPSSKAERQAGHEELTRLRANKPAKPEPCIPGSPEWESWRAAGIAHAKAKNDAFGEATHYQYHVGAIFMGFAFEIKGSGDTWEEAFEAAKGR